VGFKKVSKVDQAAQHSAAATGLFTDAQAKLALSNQLLTEAEQEHHDTADEHLRLAAEHRDAAGRAAADRARNDRIAERLEGLLA